MPINNTFSENFDDTANNQNAWTGLLVQLGSFDASGSPLYFKEATFFKDGSVVKVLQKDEFTWMNIVYERSTMPLAPMSPASEEPYLLWPAETLDGTVLCDPSGTAVVADQCATLMDRRGNTIFTQCDPCSDPVIVQDLCVRTRAIHGRFVHVSNFLTIWQGDSAIEVEFEGLATSPEGRLDSRYGIRSDSELTLDVYLAASNCTMTPVPIDFDWDQVVFTANRLPGQGGGLRQDPPWP